MVQWTVGILDIDFTSHFVFFFFNDTATTEIYTLSLHDALPISTAVAPARGWTAGGPSSGERSRSEEHTSELQSRRDIVCRLLLEKKKIHIISLNLRLEKYLLNLKLKLTLSE